MLAESNISLGPARDGLRHECLLRGGAVNRQPCYRARNLQRTTASEETDVAAAIAAATACWGPPGILVQSQQGGLARNTATIATRVARHEYCHSRSKEGTQRTLQRSQQGGARKEYCHNRNEGCPPGILKGGPPGILPQSQQGGPARNTATIATRGLARNTATISTRGPARNTAAITTRGSARNVATREETRAKRHQDRGQEKGRGGDQGL